MRMIIQSRLIVFLDYNCIEGDTIQIGTALVEEDMAKTIRGEDTEFHTTDEAPAAFDILFRSLNPKA